MNVDSESESESESELEFEIKMEETPVETPQTPQTPQIPQIPSPTTVSRQNPNQTMAPETIYLTKPMDPLQMVPFK